MCVCVCLCMCVCVCVYVCVCVCVYDIYQFSSNVYSIVFMTACLCVLVNLLMAKNRFSEIMGVPL